MSEAPRFTETLLSYPSVQLLDDLILSQEPDSIWGDGNNRGQVLELINDKTAQPKARFNALLILAFRDKTAFGELEESTKAVILTDARADDFFDYDTHWGELWESDDIGTLGYMLVECGEDAIPYLVKLFDNETEKTTYYGSEEATIMAMKHYRVKDFAAYYVARIKNYDLHFVQDLKARDATIEKMRIDLGL